MNRQAILLVLALVMSSLTAMAQKYSATFDNSSPKQAVTILREATGYEFFYPKSLLDGNKVVVNGKYVNLPLDSLLDKIIEEQLGLSYKILDRTVVLSQPSAIDGKTIKQRVRGIVEEEDGEPLIGAVVLVKGVAQGVVTDADGRFVIDVEGRDPELSVSYVGMNPVNVKLNNRDLNKPLRIVLKPVESILDEVVVTGYQNLKRENATGSYQVITSKDLDTKSTSDLASRLEGSVPGLVMDARSKSSDEDAFVIRGVGTFQAKTSPLVVVDGLPIDGGMSTVNPYDIENITILKDAAAASIYGARASNGVIVITTKQAKTHKLQVDVNADITVSEKKDYSNYGWANAAQLIELEKYNFNAMLAEDGHPAIESILTDYNVKRRNQFSPVMRLLLANYAGELSTQDMNSTLESWSANNYRSEYQDVHDRARVTQLYNISLRHQGNSLRSSLNVSYKMDNMGVQREDGSTLSFKYRGDLAACRWLDLSFGVNVINKRNKTHDLGSYGTINSFLPYQSMYNPDGTLAGLETDVYLGADAFAEPRYELKDHSFNLVNEMSQNYRKYRYTNTRTFIHANFNILKGWKATAQFQYEDIYTSANTTHEKDTYYMRDIFNKYTTAKTEMVWVEDKSKDWWGADLDMALFMKDPAHYGKKQESQIVTTHNIPDGGAYIVNTKQSQFYTFRAQTSYNNTFGKHSIDALAGMEFRQTHTSGENHVMLGYDGSTLTNLTKNVNWAYVQKPTSNVFGSDVPVHGAPAEFSTSDVLHRYYSVYFVGNYSYDGRYSLSGSYRVDKTDLFGSDPKFRGRPLWSIGASWNMHNEGFMQPLTWVKALKLRGSYGLAGNIDPNSTSYLTAEIGTNFITGGKKGTLQTPPNDQLRWEKTATWNFGLDFSLFNYRLNGSVDYYHKSGSDLLTVTDLDWTSGWMNLTINSGNMVNRGIEVQLNGNIIRQTSRKSLGVNLGLNLAYNHNEVTSVSHPLNTGDEYLISSYLHEGYPINSLFSFYYTGIKEENGLYYMGWRDKDGNEHTSYMGNDLKPEDVIYSGSATPVYTGSLTPTVTWNGFSLSAMLNYYGGHYMRVGLDEWYPSVGSQNGYKGNWGNSAISAEALNYWHGDKSYPANGYNKKYYQYFGYGEYRHDNVVHADYLKVRNIMLSYNFDPKLCRKIGFSDIRLRFQMNNVATWARNSRNLDPEAVSNGKHIDKIPRSYTFSVFFSL